MTQTPPVDRLDTVKLVKARQADAETLAEISKRAFDSDVTCGAAGPGGPPGYDSPAAQARYMRGCDYYKILYEGRIVGAIMAIRRRPRYYECVGLFVDPDYHNRGIATRVFDLLWGTYPLARVWRVGTPAWNVRTKHFYEKLGFVKVGMDGPDGVIYERIMP